MLVSPMTARNHLTLYACLQAESAAEVDEEVLVEPDADGWCSDSSGTKKKKISVPIARVQKKKKIMCSDSAGTRSHIRCD